LWNCGIVSEIGLPKGIINDKPRSLREIYRILKTDGVAFVSGGFDTGLDTQAAGLSSDRRERIETIETNVPSIGITAIRVSSLSKYFSEIRAVDGISFEVKKGELFGFLGPNGAGKTTTQRMLTGVLKPDSGTIHIMEFNLFKNPFDAKMLMGIVPEMSNTYIDLSAWDNLMLMGELYGVPKRKRKQKAMELLELFGLGDRKDQKTKGFSKGMKQRLILAMALIHEPKLLFLDEPTSGLDVQSARLIRNLVRELNQNGVTVFLTTHNIEEANQICSLRSVVYFVNH